MAVCAAIASATRKRSEVVKSEGVLLAPRSHHETNITADFWRKQVAFYTSCNLDFSVLVSKYKKHSDTEGIRTYDDIMILNKFYIGWPMLTLTNHMYWDELWVRL